MPTRKTTYCFTFYLIFFLLLAGHTISLSGQNNPYKISDSLYTLYHRLFLLRTDARCIALTDTLFREAGKQGDKKAQCLALTVPVQYYASLRDYAHKREAIERLKDVSRANGYLQYYYYAWNEKVVDLLNAGNSLRALQEAELMKKQAFTDNHPYGIFICLRQMGHIQIARHNFAKGKEYYKEALDYMLKNLPDQDPSRLYNDVAACDLDVDPRNALEYAGKAVECARTDAARVTALITKCRALSWLNRPEDFNACYEEVLKLARKIHYPDSSPGILALNIYKAMYDKDFARAHALADKFSVKGESLMRHSDICFDAGDYLQAYRYLRKYHAYQDSINNLTQSSDIAEFNALMGNERLKLENSRLDLKNAGLMMEQMQQQMTLEQYDAANDRLTLENRELELKSLHADADRKEADIRRQKAENLRQKDLLEQQEETAHYRLIIFSIVIFFLLALVAFLIFYLQRRRKSMRQLQKKNQELAVARDEAQSANRMKSLFIQNMSHEIRTPLNSIVGFSQLIANPDMELEPEEQQEYSELIVSNSELLTTLVNDLLGLSELQSGKYVTKIASHSCADLCRESIATVTHRKPQDVKLYYTCDTPPDYTILTDGQRVRQVLINFLTNAEKHTERGEIHLHCSLTEVPGSVTFSVADTGCGIPPEEAEHIFGRFEKLDDFSQGFGLGLSICRLIADYMGAAVKLDTSYKGGARFLFVLPVNDNL
ncbi:sensor histidine kinase [Bacteroides helcogenes]|uniref:histidine kinase n=1 Tax=Bacteroides helcogenes (strain ATCC 35417 / DSM 20613 / JCM 6297 / CCUG 15421 / P 36-108) TaxID=693979 RepID=E6SWL9_BACT6|nr:HAMP domain-containing sensor histidine kinase [Bacteroides helcogenes]ADV42617.1 integral membrane sensor signal transduction histidine kinase [Bacteroides helcogenes P 36-108]